MTADELIGLPHDEMVASIMRWTTSTALKSREWNFWRRDDQLPPPDDWHIWLVMAGRGYGKALLYFPYPKDSRLPKGGAK